MKKKKTKIKFFLKKLKILYQTQIELKKSFKELNLRLNFKLNI